MGKDEGVGTANARGVAQQLDQPLELVLQLVAAGSLFVGAYGQGADPLLGDGPNIGNGFPGVREAIACTDARLFCGEICDGVGHVLLIVDMGSVACHSPNRFAIPRHTSGLRRSAGVHTLPGMYL